MEFEQKSGPFYNDMLQIYRSLHIITNNSPNSIGGGGTPLRPLAPPICGA